MIQNLLNDLLITLSKLHPFVIATLMSLIPYLSRASLSLYASRVTPLFSESCLLYQGRIQDFFRRRCTRLFQ